MREWQAESVRWTDATVKTVAAASTANKARLETWVEQWEPRVISAVKPLADAAFGADAEPFMTVTTAAQSARRMKLGLAR
jgi:phenol hydroxylase P1 protein